MELGSMELGSITLARGNPGIDAKDLVTEFIEDIEIKEPDKEPMPLR